MADRDLVEILSPMKCIHLKVQGDDLAQYFWKRRINALYIQPKLNGIRALWYYGKGLYTRGGHCITSVPHIVESLLEFSPDRDLDGELFHPTMDFNLINGASRRIEPSDNSMQLEYHVFDAPIPGETQQERLDTNEIQMFELMEDSVIKEVYTSAVSPGYLDHSLRVLLAQGFEGMIMRKPDSLYREGRHVGNLWAVKPVFCIEAEFYGFLDPGEGTTQHQGTFGSLTLRHKEISIEFGAWSHKEKEKRVPLYPRFKCVRWDK